MKFQSLALLALTAGTQAFTVPSRTFVGTSLNVIGANRKPSKVSGYDLDFDLDAIPAPAPAPPAPVKEEKPKAEKPKKEKKVKEEKPKAEKKAAPAPTPAPVTTPAPVKEEKKAPVPVKKEKPAPTPKAAPVKAEKDANALPLGVALGGAPLIVAPFVALSAARSTLTSTKARRDEIAKEIEEFEKKEAARLAKKNADTDGATLGKAVVSIIC